MSPQEQEHLNPSKDHAATQLVKKTINTPQKIVGPSQAR